MQPVNVTANASESLAAAVAYYNPTAAGGSMLAKSAGLGEPLNVIISGLSSPTVLTNAGFINYAKAIGFSTECLGQHIGNPQSANLGDGHDYVNETLLLRQHYGDPDLGTCLESLIGGNHFRVYRQNGPSANSGALFLEVSKEKSAADNHDIVPDGYNIGRDLLAQWAVGTKSFDDLTYNTVVEIVEGLLPAGSEGINHGIAIDGKVAVLTVTIV